MMNSGRISGLSTILLFFWLYTAGWSQAPPHEFSPSIPWVKQMFSNPAAQALIPEFDDSYGVVFRDLNDDDLTDLFVARFRNLNRLFLNQGIHRPLDDFTIKSGLGGNLMPHGQENLELGASAVDFDNDGRIDVMIIGWGVTTRLFRQKKNGVFHDVTHRAGMKPPLDGNAGVWADVDRDGNLDVFITDEHFENHLYLNNGVGQFTEVSADYGVNLGSISQGAAFADVDGDDFPDLYVCNWFAVDVFYKNMDGKRFEPVSLPLTHLSDTLKSNGVSFGDMDNDGDLDMLVTDRDGKSRLYRNDISGSDEDWIFTDVTEIAGIVNTYPAYGGIMADFDNDGWLDIFFTNIGPNQLFLNTGRGRFQLAYRDPVQFISLRKYYSTGAAVADLDLDGDLDLFVANKDTHSVLYRNPLNRKNYLRFRLEGVRSNRDAIGTKVWLYCEQGKNVWQNLAGYREISGGSGYLSFCEPIAHFGVNPDSLYTVRVRFPSGIEILRHHLRAGQVVEIQEYAGIRKAFFRFFQMTTRLIKGENFWGNLGLFLLLIGIIGGYILFAIQRYRWRNQHITFFLVGLLVILYVLFWILSGTETRWVLLGQVTAILVLVAMTTGFMEKIRRLELQRYGYRRLLHNFSQELIFIKSNKELYDRLVDTIHQAMEVDFCTALEIVSGRTRCAAMAGASAVRISDFQISTQVLERLREQDLFSIESENRDFPDFTDFGAELILLLRRKKNLYAFLLLGTRKNGKTFQQEDLSLLQTLANQAAIAIENNLYIEETKKLIQKVTEAETREKYVKELEKKNRTLQQLYRELQETQSQLIQSEKMAGLGQLVAGIAHELNNPISYVYANMKALQNYIEVINQLLSVFIQYAHKRQFQGKLQQTLETLRKNYDLDFIHKDIQSLIQESIQGSQRVKEVVQNLRNFSRLDEAEFKSVDLHEGLDSTLMLLNNEIKNRIRIHKEYGSLPKVLCHPGHINQVFMNILLNAVQAIEEKGNIWITTRKKDGEVHIEIRDDGKGIPVAIRNKIFDPFFSTKPVGKGTGLGLSICYNIIKEHKGNITVESEEGKGTVFRIVLPVVPEVQKT